MAHLTKRFVLLAIFITVVAITYGQQCSVVPKCTCKYGDENVDVEEQDTGNEALAGAVGALGSVVVSGGGFGLWYLLRGRNSGSVSFDRSDSSMSEESVGRGKEGKGPPAQYNKKSEAESEYVKTPNIYTAGQGDNLTHKVGFQRAGADF
ncbi:uncharacterized protein LOC123545489 [Mercenaria mercenaria]|uniref:uncharacterized protein LOC123545489 n=1 Tax=Mercenaria mercenaria TaxID=6596 RepID=UPI00234ED136|nr:uncharacterized protein LOC123545489 [Mercenaria mercenaria]